MESSFAQQMKEEFHSKRIGKCSLIWSESAYNLHARFFKGLMEDLEDMRMEAEEKKRSKKRRRLDDDDDDD